MNTDAEPHSLFEDLVALGVGAVLVSLGLAFFQSAGLLTSGISGVAFLLHYATGWEIGTIFFVINLPFYWIAWHRLGKVFVLKTFVAVASISLLVGAAPAIFTLERVHPAYAAVAGGVLVGMGLLALFRHGASVGGVSTLAVYLQDARGWRAGHVLMAIDALIFAAAFFVIEPRLVLWSVLGAVTLNLMVVLNHKPGRYMTL